MKIKIEIDGKSITIESDSEITIELSDGTIKLKQATVPIGPYVPYFPIFPSNPIGPTITC